MKAKKTTKVRAGGDGDNGMQEIHLRSRDKIQIVFHLGAKARDDVQSMAIADPCGLITWLAKDRCLVKVGGPVANKDALAAIVREWIEYV
jgi:hypothetical protein